MLRTNWYTTCGWPHTSGRCKVNIRFLLESILRKYDMLFDSTCSSFCLSNARSLLTYIIFSPQITYPNMRSEQNQACSCLMPRIPRLLRYFLPQRLVSSHCELCAYPRQFYTILPLTSNLLFFAFTAQYRTTDDITNALRSLSRI